MGEHVLIFEKWNTYQQFYLNGLFQAGYTIVIQQEYSDHLLSAKPGLSPDLIIISASELTHEVENLFNKVVPGPIPVMVLLRNFTSAEMRALFQAGAADVYYTPVTQDELVTNVKAVLQRYPRRRSDP